MKEIKRHGVKELPKYFIGTEEERTAMDVNAIPAGSSYLQNDGTEWISDGEGWIQKATASLNLSGTGLATAEKQDSLIGIMRKDYVGMSTDAKPIINNPQDGIIYTFLELDTEEVYICYKGDWVVI